MPLNFESAEMVRGQLGQAIEIAGIGDEINLPQMG
jgi:hypothetical protein